MEKTGQPLLVTAAMIVRDGKILLVKRARDPFDGHFSFVSGIGAFEETSDPYEAVKLEVKGDISCKFQPTFFTMNYEMFGIPTVTLFFYGDIEGTPEVSLKYVSEARWFTFDEASRLKMGFDHSKILSEFIRRAIKDKS